MKRWLWTLNGNTTLKDYWNFQVTPRKHGKLWKKWSENLNFFTQPYRAKLSVKNVIYEEKHIANTFNNFSINIGPKLADDIPTAARSFESYIQNTDKTKEEPITINELKDTFFPPK